VLARYFETLCSLSSLRTPCRMNVAPATAPTAPVRFPPPAHDIVGATAPACARRRRRRLRTVLGAVLSQTPPGVAAARFPRPATVPLPPLPCRRARRGSAPPCCGDAGAVPSPLFYERMTHDQAGSSRCTVLPMHGQIHCSVQL
jgi:hypothetical protein